MICKDLAYSLQQVTFFLQRMQGVRHVENHTYAYGAVRIVLKDHEQKQKYVFNEMPRCYLCLYGDGQAAEVFYRKFMIYHLTMGG